MPKAVESAREIRHLLLEVTNRALKAESSFQSVLAAITRSGFSPNFSVAILIACSAVAALTVPSHLEGMSKR
jgi:hypothetical protein